MAPKIGIYLRLSDEDGDTEESNSIQGQREIIYDFISNSELRGYEIIEFCDDGFSGTDFHRPGITELLQNAQNGDISCIIVKDFSRFGRSYLEVGSFLEQIFPFWGIRFVSINDHFDSSEAACNGEFIGTAFQNLIYDLYSRDLSQKITSARHTKAEQGKFITAFAPYGYQKSKEQRLIVDKETAPVVERIFEMALQGISMTQIARSLNEEGVPSPLLLRKMREEKLFCHCVNEEYLWHSSSISKILRDQRYVGDAVYGRVKPKKVGSKLGKDVPKEAWVVVPNTHEGIVEREVFEKINAKRKRYEARKKTELYPLWKKVRCGVCNHSIPRKFSGRDKTHKMTATYCCTASKTSETLCCYPEKIEEQCIANAILLYLNQLTALVYDVELQEKQFQQRMEKMHNIQRMIKQYERKQKQIALAQMKQYEMYREHKLDKNTFLEKKKENQKLFQETKENLEREHDQLRALQLDFEWIMNKPYYLWDLTREVVEIFVDGIVIEKNGSIRISWRFQDVLEKEDI